MTNIIDQRRGAAIEFSEYRAPAEKGSDVEDTLASLRQHFSSTAADNSYGNGSYLLGLIRISVGLLFCSYALHALAPGVLTVTYGYAFLFDFHNSISMVIMSGLLLAACFLILGIQARLLVALGLVVLGAFSVSSAFLADFGWERWMLLFSMHIMSYAVLRYGPGKLTIRNETT